MLNFRRKQRVLGTCA